jgi:hypothetical protein
MSVYYYEGVGVLFHPLFIVYRKENKELENK